MSLPKELRLGWIGLGSMGLAMATNMQNYITQQILPPLKYWNRTLSRGDTLKVNGAVPSSSIVDLFQQCDIIFISVSDDTVLQSIVTTLLASNPTLDGKIILDTTTVHPSTSSSIVQQLSKVKVTYLSSPVFGATPLAVSGNLLIAIAGPPTAIDLVSPFLTGVIARSVIRVGPEPSQALLLKTTSNLITAGLMMLLSEAHTLAARTGLPAAVLEDLVAQNFGDYALGVSKRLTGGAYYPPKGEVPTSRLELGIKDVGHGVGIAREQGMRLGIGEMYLEAAEEARKYGEDKGRRCDSSSVFGVVRRRAGLEFATDMVKERDGDAKSEKK
ncbi:MmsB 3-hydroxyisobutyrate dehydrogenase [Pyrenophora tritici-repentis]|uniref:MmsB, 3-hydroxyisobutyrate dehydrogenase and related beta-hydroxyacid dehydrogenase n=1 Tax=Pyrenophora tritici-repentis TaxID=45151 RepID=A0A2W1DK47_9PLEO|nr:MmsB 3-hydroxyisobutyrate dehydrogenase and related beta-hydroxyacid dehydrogenase [Pyrenophora tritici-repentis]KAF7453919.1 MmsB 3-hydroxyisobutyrate dehydrogenase [Pyrenophora tritici-repentis]KAF7577008.1 MmsB, 3-hydroxyisobutyrate dehydrogenase and related beta-hydroxyacid dehydrogenase [Pyrenophora tritici-repentis]KAG9387675.1 MmsB 3-hydroxyisobutyrate dehydrogenase [Pyrenophora tritici-repentis]KAI1520782.1 NAD binding domain of 6-phosphogluconate dehydrogenase [Pyrenophora tritici-r